MSIITVVRKENQVAIAADSLSSGNSNRQESAKYIVNHQKMFRVGDSWLALCGAASMQHALPQFFAKCEQTPLLNSVDAIYKTWILLHEVLKREYFLLPHGDSDDSFETSRSDVLIANDSGIYAVEAHRSVYELSRFFAFGSGEDYALGAMFVAFEDDSKSAEEVARLGVAAAIEWNSDCGAPIFSQSMILKSC